jgi:hypothetical protein
MSRASLRVSRLGRPPLAANATAASAAGGNTGSHAAASRLVPIVSLCGHDGACGADRAHPGKGGDVARVAAFPPAETAREMALGDMDTSQCLRAHNSAVLDPSRDETYVAIAGLYAEFGDVFPDATLHVGADEVIQSCFGNIPPSTLADTMVDEDAVDEGERGVEESRALAETQATALSTDEFAEEGLRVEHATITTDISHPSRGELEIQLTSPDGTTSRLAEKHTSYAADPADYPDWTFSTVHNWGEDSRGLWKLKIADRVSGNTGTLNSATLTLYGTAK